MNFLTHINLNKNELQNAKIQNLATAPASPTKGQIYYNTTENSFFGFDGTTWLDLAGVGFSGDYNDLINRPTLLKIDDAAASLTSVFSSEKVEGLLSSKVDKVAGKSLVSNAEIARLAGVDNYTLPTASPSVLGGIKVGAGLSVTNGVLSTTGGGVADSVEWTNVLNKPSFSAVATSGSYNDLANRPNIPTNESFTLAGLSDTNIASATTGQLLRWSGTEWVNWTPNFITPVTSVAGKTGDVVLAIADITDLQAGLDSKETPSGAQAKADAALTSSKSYTDTSIANVIGGAPEALDTLKELGDALQSTEGAYSGLLEVIGTKADLTYVDAELAKKSDVGHTHNYLPDTYVPSWEVITGKPTTFAPRKYVGIIGDGSTTKIRVSHDLGTEDFTILVKEVFTKNVVIADCKIVDANSVDIIFGSAPSAGQYKVVIIG